MKFQKRFVPLLLALVLAFGTLPVQAAALTRGEAAQALLSAAQDYNPGVQRSDILKGYPDGNLALDGTLTRAQALVMLRRAFGGFAVPVGDNARMALPTGSLTNVPAWAAEELSSVLAAGLADGDANEAMSAEALSTLLRRAYAAKGTNLKDDYYAAVNKSWLDGSDIPAGLSINGPFYGLSLTVNEQVAALYDDAHLALLKTAARLALLQSVATSLNQGFMDAYFDFVLAYYGVDARQSNEQIAAQQVQALLADYLSRAYVDEYFSAKAKADVEEMIGEFIAIYKERILAQDWMSAETKAKAVKKLDTMGVKVGYPDSWESCLDRAEIKSPAEGGSFFSNVIAIQMAMKQDVLAHQNDAPDKSEWIMTPFTVNACYNPSANDITFPAAILQSPLYDVNASREENLGGIGYIIAHEITHAFDNNGAKFDENGSAADWWTAEDYAAFRQKCQAVAEWYDGQEAYPGIACSGALTISENVADLGAAKCIVAAAKKLDHPDLDKLFRAVANTWASTTSRQMREYLAVTDVHAPDKLRCNRVLQTLPEFYTTYGIRPGDGMWTAPETRVSVW